MLPPMEQTTPSQSTPKSKKDGKEQLSYRDCFNRGLEQDTDADTSSQCSRISQGSKRSTSSRRSRGGEKHHRQKKRKNGEEIGSPNKTLRDEEGNRVRVGPMIPTTNTQFSMVQAISEIETAQKKSAVATNSLRFISELINQRKAGPSQEQGKKNNRGRMSVAA